MIEQIRQGDIPGVQLRYRHVVPTTPQETWFWLTEPKKMTGWFASRVDADPDAQDKLVLESTAPMGETYREHLVSISEDPPFRWTADLQNVDGSWAVPTRLEIELTPAPEGTEISILQKGFAHLPLSDCLTIWEFYRRRWRSALTRLENLLDDHSSNL